MSWKDRATPVTTVSTNDWKSRALPAEQQALLEIPTEQPSSFKNASHAISQALDYLGGGVRVGAASAADLVRDHPIVTDKDIELAKAGMAPKTAEFLKRADVGPGTSWSDIAPWAYSDTGEGLPLQKGGPLDPSERDVAGFMGDVATDPLTYASGGAAVLSKLENEGLASKVANTVLNPIKTASRAGGEKHYKSAFKNIDKDLVSAGKAPISGPMLESGFTGNMQQARAANLGLQKGAGSEIGAVLDEAAAQGIKVPMSAATKDAMELTEKMRTSPHPDVVAAADKLDDIIFGYLQKGEEVPVNVLNTWKSEANTLAGKNAFNPLAGSVPLQDQIERALGSGMKGQIEKAVGESSPELLARLEKANSTYGSAKEARKSFQREAKKEVTKNPITVIDGTMLGAAVARPEVVLPMLASKKIIEHAMSTRGRTTIGKALNTFGKTSSGLTDEVARRGLWELINGQRQGEQP